MDFLGGSALRIHCSARNTSWIPGSSRSPQVGNGNRTSILALKISRTEEPSRLSPLGRKGSDMTEQLCTYSTNILSYCSSSQVGIVKLSPCELSKGTLDQQSGRGTGFSALWPYSSIMKLELLLLCHVYMVYLFNPFTFNLGYHIKVFFCKQHIFKSCFPPSLLLFFFFSCLLLKIFLYFYVCLFLIGGYCFTIPCWSVMYQHNPPS